MFKHVRLKHFVAASLTSLFCFTSGASNSATLSLFGDLASFSAAAGAPLLTQDFEGIATGTQMSGVEFLPGISATTTRPSLEIFSSVAVPNHRLFGIGSMGSSRDSRYDITVGGARQFIAFDITGFEAEPGAVGSAVGPGQLTVFFADATSQSIDIFGNLTGAHIFVGLGADVAITSVRWAEPLEGSGFNEETALDNFRTTEAARVPVPATLGLFGLGLGLLGVGRRRAAA